LDDATDLRGEFDRGNPGRSDEPWMGLAYDFFCCGIGWLGVGRMDLTRSEIILVLGITALVFRAVPQLFFVGEKFPETWDRLLRYLSYALLCGIISTTLFMQGASFESDMAPYRVTALIVAVIVARKTKSAVTGMLIGTIVVSVLSWF
jgi:branched-subunit amino acid transport protein